MLRYLPVVLIALLLALAPACAQEFNVFHQYAKAPTATPATVSFVGCTASSSDLTTYTFTDHATGTAGNRTTIVAAYGEDGASDFSPVSMTIGGVSANAQTAAWGTTSRAVQGRIFSLANPSGTTATIAVTFSEAITAAQVCVWAAYDLQSATATDSATNETTDGSPVTLDTDVPADGIAVGGGINGLTGACNVTYVGLTEQFSDDPSGEFCGSAADFDNDASADVPLTISCDIGAAASQVCGVAAFR